MTEMPQNPQNIYELIENDNGEVMVLIYAGSGAPQKPTFTLNEGEHMLELARAKGDIVQIAGLQPETIEKLKQLKTLYICEMKYVEDPEAESEIIHAYAASSKKKALPPEPNAQTKPNKQEMLSERVRQAKQNILNKSKPDGQ